jgi:transcriptional regulator with XRE-family HTH domain
MNNEKMAHFIFELRKAKKLTQKELAEKLNVTDKAVSKWERGLSCPDVSLLNSLSNILGVTTSELLNGERSEVSVPEIEAVVETTLKYVDEVKKINVKKIRTISGITLSILCFIAMMVCAICDYAISGRFTWSLYPFLSIVFAWLLLYPIIQYEKKGILISLITFTALIIPFLYLLNKIIGDYNLITIMGKWISLVAIIYLWAVYTIFKVMKLHKLKAAAVSSLLAIPASFVITVIIANYISEPIIDVWDVLTYSLLIVLAIVLLGFEKLDTRKRNSKIINTAL